MRKSLWLLSAGLFALSMPAYAQDPAPETDTDDTAAVPTQGATAEGAAVDDATVQPNNDTADGEIIVTATRRNEALSDVPLAVSAVTGQQLENTGAADIRQLQQISPSLLVTSTQSEGAATARIRGIGTVGDNPGLESSVGVFIDGVYRSRTGVGLTELGPIDRVEVLRGPQGTLFGRNTSAGLLSIITAKPLFTPFVGGQLDIGNYDMRRVELSATGPVSDSFAIRADGVYLKRDGFVEDLISGRDVNNRDRFLIRAQGLYQPTDDLSVRIIGDYSKRDEECCAAPYLPASDYLAGEGRVESSFKPIMEGLGGIVPDDPFDRKVVISPGRSYRGDVKDWGLSGEVVYDFGGAELTSITAYRVNDLTRGTDVDYSNLDLVYRPDDGSVFNKFKTFTQELRLQGEAFGGRLDWLVGGYYANEKLRSVDSLKYGNDYDSFTNCLVASNFAASLIATGQALNSPTVIGLGQGLVVPTANNSTCVNPATAGAVAGLLASNPTNQLVFSSLARIGPFSGLTGNVFENLAQVGPFGALPDFTIANSGFVDDFRQTSNNFALFTHNIFEITDRLNLTVGARYTTETKRLDSTLQDDPNLACAGFSGSALAFLPCIIPSVTGGEAEIDGKRTENRLTGTVVLSYKPTDRLLTYASYSRGYKAGGFNLDRSALSRVISQDSTGANVAGSVCPTSGTLPAGCLVGGYASADQLEFEPEIVDALELGAKYNGPGIDVNVALFRQLFRNFQLNTFNGINFLVENINSCKNSLDGGDTDNSPLTGECEGGKRAGVKSQGVEVEVFSRPIRDVNLNFGVTYADTRYRKDLVGSEGRPLATALYQLSGRRVSNAPPWTVTSSLGWTPPIGGTGLRGLFYIDMRHQSGYNTGSDLDLEKIEDGYTVFNGRVGIRGPNDGWALEFWGQNLFDEDVKQIGFDAFLQGQCTQRGANAGFCSPTFGTNRSNQLFGVFLNEPRTYGMTLRAKWGPSRAPVPAYVAPPAPPPPQAPEPVVEQAPPPPPPPPASGERG